MMEILLLELEEELRTAVQAMAQGVHGPGKKWSRCWRRSVCVKWRDCEWNWRPKRQPWNSFRLPSAAELSLRWAAPGS